MFTLSISSEDKAALEKIREFLKEHLYVSAFDSIEFELTQTIHYPIVKEEDVVKPLSSTYMIGDLVVPKGIDHGPVYRIVDLTNFPAQVGLRYMGCETLKRTITYASPKMLEPLDIGRPKYGVGCRVQLDGVSQFINDYRIIWHSAYGRFVHQYMVDDYPGIWWAESEFDRVSTYDLRVNKEGKRCI